MPVVRWDIGHLIDVKLRDCLLGSMILQNHKKYGEKNESLMSYVSKLGVSRRRVRDNTLEELNAAVIMMAHIKPTDDKSNAKPTYDVEFISEVNASQIDMISGLLSKSDHE
ncbi:hypothetical protein Tco_0556617 [Tanacetum coccineum]